MAVIGRRDHGIPLDLQVGDLSSFRRVTAVRFSIVRTESDL
ncbi:MAG: hypothetical protein QOI01_1703 [Mycobacterium sp.]|jgi:hypothetical protein|nr:hypothetical protein [Mycobacterium sp.]